jgi:hypothetical protein
VFCSTLAAVVPRKTTATRRGHRLQNEKQQQATKTDATQRTKREMRTGSRRNTQNRTQKKGVSVSNEQAVKHGPRPARSTNPVPLKPRREGTENGYSAAARREEARREGGGTLPALASRRVAWLGFGGMRTKRKRGRRGGRENQSRLCFLQSQQSRAEQGK